VLPSGGDALADVGTELVVMTTGREYRLRKAFEQLDSAHRYDLVLLDCPPALDMLTINALTCATRVVIVTTAALWSSEGIARLLTTVDAIREYSNPHLTLAGVIVNSVERTRRQNHWLEDLRVNSPAPVWLPAVPKATWIAEAAEAGQGHCQVNHDLDQLYCGDHKM
jgi:chromosome partitioning protein